MKIKHDFIIITKLFWVTRTIHEDVKYSTIDSISIRTNKLEISYAIRDQSMTSILSDTMFSLFVNFCKQHICVIFILFIFLM